MGSSADSRYWTCPSCNKQFDWETGHRRVARHDPAKCMAQIESKDKPKKDEKFTYVVTAYKNGSRELHSYRVIDELIESARLLGLTQAKRGYGVYTQDDAIMERAFWEGVEARAKAIRDEVVALKEERDAAMKDAERYRWLAANARSTSEHWGGRWSLVIDGPAPKRHDCEDALDEAIDAAIAKAEGCAG